MRNSTNEVEFLFINNEEKSMQTLKNIGNWLLWSSENSNKISLTIRGLAGFIPSAVLLFAALHIDVSANQLADFVESLVALVSTFGAFVGAVAFLYGIVRKISLTILGQNDALK